MLEKKAGIYLLADIAREIGTDNSNISGVAHEYEVVIRSRIDGSTRLGVDEEGLKIILNRDWRTRNSREVKRRCQKLSKEIFGESIASYSKELDRLNAKRDELVKELSIIDKKIERAKLDIELEGL